MDSMDYRLRWSRAVFSRTVNQKNLLFFGIVLAILAIGASAANRMLKAKDKAARAAVEAKAEQEYEESQPPPTPKGDLRKVLLKRETVGELELRVSGENEAKLFTADGKQIALVKGFAGVREVPGTTLFGKKVVELAGKTCRDPCNPTSAIVASPGGKPRTVLEAQGIVRFEDLDGDGTPEALIEHLVNHTAELVTLPYALEKEKFVPAYGKFPEKVDKQIEELSRSAERSCEASPEGDCRDTLLALLVARAFTQKDDLKALVSGLKIDQQLKVWAKDEGLQRDLEHEIKGVAR
ncbi:MAG TPA: hypothetical protein VGK67_33175 [Myxococcales bacterium]